MSTPMLLQILLVHAGRDYYRLLRLPRDADAAQVKKAHRKMSARWHPDRAQDSDELAWFQEMQQAVNDAASVLLNKEKREIYDKAQFSIGRGEEEIQNAASSRQPDAYRKGSGDVLTEEFDISGLSQVREKAEDQMEELRLNFTQCLHGAFVDVPVKRLNKCPICKGEGGSQVRDCPHCKGRGHWRQMKEEFPGIKVQEEHFCEICEGTGRQIAHEHTCKACGGRGLVVEEEKIRVIVKAGAKTGDMVRIDGEGSFEEGERKLPRGDVVFEVFCEESYSDEVNRVKFGRIGQDLIANVYLREMEILNGAVKEIQLPGTQTKISVQFPKDSFPSTRVTVSGKGFPGAKAGDFVAVAAGVLDEESGKVEL